MTKSEFLRELENSLTGRLSKSDLDQILYDYRDIFENGIAEGKTENDISDEIGSPAAIARTIMSENMGTNQNTVQNGEISYLATMSRRLGAYFIDTFCFVIIMFGLFISFGFAAFNTTSTSVNVVASEGLTQRTTYSSNGEVKFVEIFNGNNRIFKGNKDQYADFVLRDDFDQTKLARFEQVRPEGTFGFGVRNLIVLMVFLLGFGVANLFTALQLWIFKGYTLGKWLVRIRVVRVDGGKITFWDSFLRDCIIKTLANAVTSGLLNIGSFIWGCATPDHKTLQDLAARTKVINVVR